MKGNIAVKVESTAVCKRIDFLRRQNSLSQEQLAKVLQVSQPAISKYLRDRIPPAETLLKLAQLGQTTVEWILSGQKSYAYGQTAAEVHETQMDYDADWQVAKKIAVLPDEVREAIIRLIEELYEKNIM